ncbi:MAG: 23S rRNA (guanosine(2251)-2'-O)-methyltransferase RlmB, partial [Deltaproteobacteria bacterium]
MVAEALRARRRRMDRLWLRRGARSPELEALVTAAREAGVPVVEEDRDRLQRLVPAGAKTQGAVLEAGPLPELSLEQLLEETRAAAGRRQLVALDGVEDPQNVGAIIRTADGAGTHGLVLTRRHAPPLGPAVARASAGAVEHLPVARVPNLVRALNLLKEKGFWTVGADPERGEDLFAVDDRVLAGELVLVFGAEGRGIRTGVGSALDHRVRVPLEGGVASLNVSAAAAVVL